MNAVAATSAAINYGWRIMEGSICFNPQTNCDRTGLTLPVLDYVTGGGDCSVIGGFVYRGSAMPGAVGLYFYSDWCGGWLKSFRLEGGQAVDQRTWAIGAIGMVTSFGQDGAGELYLTTGNGRVYRLEPSD